MNKSRVFSLISLILNIAVFTLGTNAVTWVVLDSLETGGQPYLYFTVLSNVLLVLVSLFTIVFDIVSLKKGHDAMPIGLRIIKYMGVVATFVTFTTVVAFLGPDSNFNPVLFADYSLYLHAICPLLALVSFIFFECQKKMKFPVTLLALLPVIAYGTFYTIRVLTGDAAQLDALDFYNFAHVNGQSEIIYTRMGISIGGMVVGTFVLAIIAWVFNMICNRGFFKKVEEDATEFEDDVKPEYVTPVVTLQSNQNEEVKPVERIESAQEDKVEPAIVNEPKVTEQKSIDKVSEEKKADTATVKVRVVKKENTSEAKKVSDAKPKEKKTTSNVGAKKAAPKAKAAVSDQKASKKPTQTNAPANDYNGKARVYHIAKSKTANKWQVKLASGEKAIKLFDTQAEAIEFAKQLVKTQGGSIRVHSMKGSLRKA